MKKIRFLLRSFGAKITLILVLSMLFSGAMSNFLIYKYALDSQFNQLRDKLMVIAKVSALMVDPETLAKVPLQEEGRANPDFKAIEEKLAQIKKSIPAVKYVYTLAKTGKPGILKFIVDLDTADKEKPPAKPGEEYDAHDFPEMLESFNAPSADKKLTADKWGVFLSGYAPIFDKSGKAAAILGVDMAANDVYNIQKEVKRRALFILVLSVLLSVALGMIIAVKVTDPIKRLVTGTRHIALGELDYKVQVKGEDEIAELARSFNKMSSELIKHIEDLKRTTAEKERLVKEIEIAKGIQQSFLPDASPKVEGFDIVATSLPARVVGGDFYDFIPIGPDRWGLVVADVSGKGIPAALFMALSRTLIRASTLGKASIADGIKQANRLIMEDSKTNMFVTLFYTILDAKKRSLEYLNAGHNPPLLLREDTSDLILLKAQGTPLGLFDNLDVKSDEVTLKKGDIVVLYTDGVTEALNDDKEQFEIDRLVKVAREYQSASVNVILAEIQKALRNFVENQPQFDDITLMVIKAL